MNINQGALVGKRLGKYELLALLAIGGTAEIYLARIGGEAGFEKYVVVKCLLDHLADDPEYVKMFLDEARLGAQLDHSNIVQTLELGENEGRYYMAMEYLAGMSLAQVARKANQRVEGGKIPPQLVLGLAAQACAGLHYAHRKQTATGQALNLVHRDISPQNLVVSFEGILKIVDFGIAKADVRDTHTRSGTIKGKFAYMSPEQCLAKQVDHRTDIFALGVILHELLTARRLFKRTTTYETYEAIIKGQVPTPSSINPDLGPELDEVVMRALQYRKEDRYESAEHLGQALLETLHKRAQTVNASDIANFYELHFGAELKEHGDRMRLLITGKRQNAVGEETLNWGSDEIDGGPPEEESEIAIDLEGSMVVEMLDDVPELAAAATIESIDGLGQIEELDADSITLDPEPEEEEPGATRVEVNPMALLDPGSGAATTLDEAKPAGPSGKTLAPGGGAPLPRASVKAPARTPGPSAMPPAQTAGPSAKTIMPGQLSIKPPVKPGPPKVADAAPKGRGADKPRERPTVDLGPKAEATPARKTVMGVSAPDLPSIAAKKPAPPPDPKKAGPNARTLYNAPPKRDFSEQEAAGKPGGREAAVGKSHYNNFAEPARPPVGTPPGQSPMGSSPPGPPPNRAASAPPATNGQADPSLDTLPPVPPAGQQQPNRPMPMQPGQPPRQVQPTERVPRNIPPTFQTPRRRRMPKLPNEPWFVGLVFLVSLAIGLGVTLLIASL